MIIENTPPPAEIRRGRPVIYPFADLSPGQKLSILGNINISSHRLSVANALNSYKKNNDLDWASTVRIEGVYIVVYRLS